jgi:hypothetical protein
MINEETYRAAEDSLIDWVDLCISNKLSITDVVFLLQFRIFDINSNSRELYFSARKSLEDVNKDECTDRTL